MNDYRIINNNADKGVTIVANATNGNFAALVNGKYYSVTNYRPLDGNGRQLRSESISAIDELMLTAPGMYNKLMEQRNAEVAALAEKMTEKPRRSFADVLEEQFLATLTEKSASELVKEVYPAVEKLVIERFGIIPQIHEIKIPERPEREIKGVLHKDFDKIVSMISDGESVYLCGAAGTGKSYLAQQVAEVLGLEYWYTASVVDDIQLKGFIDANGRYHETQFYKAFTQGGIFLLVELDSSVPETLVLLNNALANGYFDFPVGRTTAHKDFHAIAAGNTFGTGADSTYTGRYCLDAASMDRFALISVDYDREIEMVMANGDKSLVDFAEAFRRAVAECGTTCLCTYRAIKRLAKFSAYMSKADALRIGLVKGLGADDIRTIYNKLAAANEWVDALRELF
jgi:hypothetical protein